MICMNEIFLMSKIAKLNYSNFNYQKNFTEINLEKQFWKINKKIKLPIFLLELVKYIEKYNNVIR